MVSFSLLIALFFIPSINKFPFFYGQISLEHSLSPYNVKKSISVMQRELFTHFDKLEKSFKFFLDIITYKLVAMVEQTGEKLKSLFPLFKPGKQLSIIRYLAPFCIDLVICLRPSLDYKKFSPNFKHSKLQKIIGSKFLFCSNTLNYLSSLVCLEK